MATYGGKSSYGGLSQYGGGAQLWLIYYRVMRSMLFPGLWPQDDDLAINKILRTDAKALSHAKRHVLQLEREIFPQTADECADDWADLLGVVFERDATLAQKQAALLAKSLGSLGSSLPALRRILYPLLLPTTAFYDGMDDDAVSPRYTLEGNGTRSEATSVMSIALAGAVAGSWDGSTLAPDANRVFFRVPDIADDFTLDVSINAYSFGANTAAGIFCEADAQNVTQFVFGNRGASDEVRVDQILEGALAEDVDSMAAAAPAATRYLRIRKLAGELIFSHGASVATLAEFHRVDVRHKTRRIGWFVRNGSGVNAVSASFGECTLVMDTPHNNVEIVELTEAIVDVSGEAADIFFFFVHRRPGDPGEYSIAAAQRVLDSAKQAHTLGYVGESDIFLTDDEYSLTDRDILGS